MQLLHKKCIGYSYNMRIFICTYAILIGLCSTIAGAYPELINLDQDTLRVYFHGDGTDETQRDFFEYIIRVDEDIVSLAEKVQTSLASIATLNNYPRSYQYPPRSSVLIPRRSGIYIRENPTTDLHYVLWKRLERRIGESSIISVKPSYELKVERFYFFDGERLTEQERALFLSDNEFDSPLIDFVISSPYGDRINPISGNPQFHYGIDLVASAGSPVFSSADGIVQETGFSSAFGFFLFIMHENGYRTLYAHVLDTLYSKGQRVHKGAQISYLGNTGYSTGDHLHFELHSEGKPINPIDYISLPISITAETETTPSDISQSTSLSESSNENSDETPNEIPDEVSDETPNEILDENSDESFDNLLDESL